MVSGQDRPVIQAPFSVACNDLEKSLSSLEDAVSVLLERTKLVRCAKAESGDKPTAAPMPEASSLVTYIKTASEKITYINTSIFRMINELEI